MSTYKQPLVSGVIAGLLAKFTSKSSMMNALKKGVIVAGVSYGTNMLIEPELRRMLPVNANLDFLSVDVSSALIVGGVYAGLDSLNVIADSRGLWSELLWVGGGDFASRKIVGTFQPSSGVPFGNLTDYGTGKKKA